VYSRPKTFLHGEVNPSPTCSGNPFKAAGEHRAAIILTVETVWLTTIMWLSTIQLPQEPLSVALQFPAEYWEPRFFWGETMTQLSATRDMRVSGTSEQLNDLVEKATSATMRATEWAHEVVTAPAGIVVGSALDDWNWLKTHLLTMAGSIGEHRHAEDFRDYIARVLRAIDALRGAFCGASQHCGTTTWSTFAGLFDLATTTAGVGSTSRGSSHIVLKSGYGGYTREMTAIGLVYCPALHLELHSA
jgi:hypothetical protein